MKSKSQLQLKKLNAHKSKLEKDYNDLLSKIGLIKEKKALTNSISSTFNQIGVLKCGHQRLYSLSNFHETELRGYYAEIKERAYTKSGDTDDAIERIAEKNFQFIKTIQDYIRLELEQSRRELEYESIEKFQANAKKQDEALFTIIQSEKVLFEIITSSIAQMARIKNDFEGVNQVIHKEIEDNRVLRMKLEIAKAENRSLKALIKEQERNKAALEYLVDVDSKDDIGRNRKHNDITSKELITQSNETASNVRTTTATGYDAMKTNRQSIRLTLNENTGKSRKDNPSHYRSHTEYGIALRLTSHNKTESSRQDETENRGNIKPTLNCCSDLSAITMRLREVIKLKNREQLKRSVRNNKEKALKNNMIQLVKKCLEDISYDYSLLCSPHNNQSNDIKAKGKEKLTKEMEVMTYMYDNWLSDKLKEEMNSKRPQSSCRLRLKRK